MKCAAKILGHSEDPQHIFEIPLIGWIIYAENVDFISEVTLYQCSKNNCSSHTEVTYCFPLNEGSSVYTFRAEYEDGTIINSVVKGKKARRFENMLLLRMLGRRHRFWRRNDLMFSDYQLAIWHHISTFESQFPMSRF